MGVRPASSTGRELALQVTGKTIGKYIELFETGEVLEFLFPVLVALDPDEVDA